MRYFQILPFLISLSTVLLSGCPKQNDSGEAADTGIPAETENLGAWLVQQQRFENLRQEGVIFHAIGNEPFWNVRLYDGGDFQFIRPGADTIQGTVSPGIRPADLNSITFPLAATDGNLTLVAFSDSCTDGLSGERFSHSVTLTFREKDGSVVNYQGCGLFLNDPALNDIYILDSWNTTGGDEPAYQKGNPRLEFNFANNVLKGFDGDCEIRGKFEPMGNQILFTEFDYVEAACRPEKRSRFFDHLNGQEHKLQLKEGILTLTAGDEVMVFKKVD